MTTTFEEWSETAESTATYEFSSDGIRDIYDTPFGIQIEEESILPRHWGRKPHYQTVVDVILPMEKEEWLKETYGGWLDDERYTEDGYGVPVFDGEESDIGTQKAWKFLEVEHKNLKRLNEGE